MISQEHSTPTSTGQTWYAEGLRFACAKCNDCCGGGPGYVWVSRDEIRRMAEYAGMSARQFFGLYCRRIFRGVSLKEKMNSECVMLGPEGCTVYAVRPSQCRTWPFWASNVETPQAWKRVTERCRGAGRGWLYSREEIKRIAAGEAEASRAAGPDEPATRRE